MTHITSKHIIISVLLLATTIGAYYQFSESTTSEGGGVKFATGTTVSPETVESDTGKRLETLGNSGTNWGMSPFGSGKPLTETEKPKFQKPNTEWKTRTISGVTYVFGEGNPREVALPESEIKGCSWQEGGDYCTDNGSGYVDPLLEKLVYNVLNSSDWEPLLQNCEKDFRIVDSFNQTLSESSIITYDRVLNLKEYIFLEEIFIINPQTGRKNITKEGYDKLMRLYEYVKSASDSQNSNGLGDPILGITKCVDTYGINLANMFVNIRSLPWRGSRDIPTSE